MNFASYLFATLITSWHNSFSSSFSWGWPLPPPNTIMSLLNRYSHFSSGISMYPPLSYTYGGLDDVACRNYAVPKLLLMWFTTMLPTFPISCIAAMMSGLLTSGILESSKCIPLDEISCLKHVWYKKSKLLALFWKYSTS